MQSPGPKCVTKVSNLNPVSLSTLRVLVCMLFNGPKPNRTVLKSMRTKTREVERLTGAATVVWIHTSLPGDEARLHTISRTML